MFNRLLKLPLVEKMRHSFFLWGPRQTGKSTLLKKLYPDVQRIDLLRSDEFARYSARPHLLREELQAQQTSVVVIDEVQKVPALLDEVHWLIENQNIRFVLSGSSARKLKRGQANLLGGRALRYELHGLVVAELGGQADLLRLLRHGYLPRHYIEDDVAPLLRSYVGDYLKEEIAAEGLTRNLPAFSRFLEVAALADTELIVFKNIAEDCQVTPPTVKEYFQILEDTLLGSYLLPYAKRPKRKIAQTPKFYFSDIGVVNTLTRRGALEWGGELIGKAFENWVYHELLTYSKYSEKHYPISFWRISEEAEVDFILNDCQVGIEAKAGEHLRGRDLRGLLELTREYPKVSRRIIVCREPQRRTTSEGIEVIPAMQFMEELWAGEII